MSARQLVFLACFSGMLLFGMSVITLGSMAQALQQKFMLDAVASGTLFSILPMGILSGALLFGPVSDRYGFRWLLAGAALAMGLGFEGIAWSDQRSLLYLSVYLFGFGGGILNGATSAVVNDISTEHKGANLSILGVFFGVGAVGMPLLLGLLGSFLGEFQILAGVGFLVLLAGAWYLTVPFPGGKTAGMPLSLEVSSLIHPLMFFVAFFLFFQSGLEGLINNWSTTYLTEQQGIANKDALFGLSIHMSGMIVMRLLTGSIFRHFSKVLLMWAGLAMVLVGIWVFQVSADKWLVWTGLFLAGSGLALGFPVLLGFLGEQFARISGTAFSLAFSVALVGNLLFNYGMGLLIDWYGLSAYRAASAVAAVLMVLLFVGVSASVRKIGR